VVIKPDEVAALEWMGSFKRILEPGWHPLWLGSSIRRRTTRMVQNSFKTETKTKDNVFVNFEIAVQQSVMKGQEYQAIYKLDDPAQQIRSFVEDVVRAHAPLQTLDELFESKTELANSVRDRLTENMTRYGYQIHQVLVTEIEPDGQVKAAMNQINAQRRMRQAATEKAEAEKVVLVKAAEAESESKFLQGQGVARSREAIVSGLKEAVLGKNHEGQLGPKAVTELLLLTQYLDTLEKVAAGPAKVVFVPSDTSTSSFREAVMEGSAAS